MNKETLTLAGIRCDLQVVMNYRIVSHHRKGNVYLLPYLSIVAALGAYLKSAWVGLAGLVPIVVYWAVVRARNYTPKRQALCGAILRDDISISVEQFSHVSEEIIYEPYKHRLMRGGVSMTKRVFFYHFESGLSWREPSVKKHYKWSRDFYITPQGLENISLGGDEFYFVSLQSHPEIAYIYPCKTFELDRFLKENETT